VWLLRGKNSSARSSQLSILPPGDPTLLQRMAGASFPYKVVYVLIAPVLSPSAALQAHPRGVGMGMPCGSEEAPRCQRRDFTHSKGLVLEKLDG
jgi:hypothetical protein